MTPFFLDRAMRRKSFEKHRLAVAQAASGIVLEIGFGSGLNLPYYRNVSKLYALDPSSDLFTLAKTRIEKAPFPVEFLQASAEQIPLADASVDAVVSTWSLCTIPHPQLALKEVLRVLKPGGIFSFIEHGKSPNRFVAAVQKYFTPFSKCFAGGCHLDREIETLIRGSGFDVQKLDTFSTWSMPLAYMYRGLAVSKCSSLRNSEKTFRWIVGVLGKHNVPFIVTGGLSAKSYGSPRPLNDIDIDIHDADLERILEDIRPHITFGPARYRDERWDLLLVTLNHEGQEVDIACGDTLKICDIRTGVWSEQPTDFADIEHRHIFGINVPVISRRGLVEYKSMLQGEHQAIDIKAALTAK